MNNRLMPILILLVVLISGCAGENTDKGTDILNQQQAQTPTVIPTNAKRKNNS